MENYFRRVPAGPKVREWAREHRLEDWRAARIVEVAKELDAPLAPFLTGLVRKPPKYLRFHGDLDRAGFTRRRLEQEQYRFRTNKMDPNVLEVLMAPHAVGATHEHMLGNTTPQDLASAAPSLALDPGSAEIVIDACAAPGGKTLHISDLMQGGGAIIACEPLDARRRALRFNVDRTRLQNVGIHAGTFQSLEGEMWADRIIIDAPCTGEGTLPTRRRRSKADSSEVMELAAIQADILDAADRLLKPGGILVYSTCTFGPEENESQVQSMLERGYTIEPTGLRPPTETPLAPGLRSWGEVEYDQSMTNCRRFLPGIHPTLGFFVAKLRKGRFE